ncbi:transposable element Tc1 transposase [Trichonephila clavipes]|nr:transposable element Tc1 transposase [Trichonephila clavipes]
MVVQALTSQTSLHRIRSIDCNGVELTAIGLWTCGKLFFGEMNLALQSGSRMDASGFWRMPGERFFSDCIVPTVKFGGGSIMQDNCSIHTSRLAQTWFGGMGVQKLDWPSQSPDLNPIEHLWNELERRLRSQPNRPSSLQALTSAVMDAWKAISMVTYQKLVESLPKCAGCHPCKRETNIILICASGCSKSIQLGVRILLAR